VDPQQTQVETDVEWIHEIGGHMAAGNTLDVTLAHTVSFAGALANCDACLIYLQEGAELTFWIWKHQGDIEHSKITTV
jgi:hypothetical protein